MGIVQSTLLVQFLGHLFPINLLLEGVLVVSGDLASADDDPNPFPMNEVGYCCRWIIRAELVQCLEEVVLGIPIGQTVEFFERLKSGEGNQLVSVSINIQESDANRQLMT